MGSLRAEIETEVFGKPIEVLRRRAGDHPVIGRCWRVLDARALDESLHLGIAERHCGVDRSYLNRLLRHKVGYTFHQLRIGIRLSEAALLLRTSDDSILDVALDVGFGSVRSFQRNFQRVFGVTAQEYRARAGRSDL